MNHYLCDNVNKCWNSEVTYLVKFMYRIDVKVVGSNIGFDCMFFTSIENCEELMLSN